MIRLFKFVLKILLYNSLNFFPILLYSLVTYLKIYNKFNNYKKIIAFESSSIGVISANLIFAIIYIKKNNLKKKNVVLITNQNKKFNFLLSRFKHILNIKYDNKIFNLIKKANYKIIFTNKLVFIKDDLSENRTLHNFFDKYIYKPELSKDDLEFTRKLLIKLGLSINDKIVLINNRSSYFWLKENQSIEKQKIDEPRNNDFSKFNLTLKYLKNLGYKVVRIGDYERDLKNYNYISLQNLNKKEQKLALIYLPTIAQFAITPDSGITGFLSLYKLPILIHNLITVERPPANFIGIFLPKKKFIKNKNNKPLSFKEQESISDYFIDENPNSFFRFKLERIKLSSIFHQPKLNHFNIKLIQNEEDEILESVKEILDLINDNQNFINKFKNSEKNFINKIKNKYIYHSPKFTFFSKNYVDKYDFFRSR